MKTELVHTLMQLIDSVHPAEGTGLVITEADLEVPLEVGSVRQGGRLIFYGAAPHSRWQAGFLPQISTGRLRVVLDEEAAGGR